MRYLAMQHLGACVHAVEIFYKQEADITRYILLSTDRPTDQPTNVPLICNIESAFKIPITQQSYTTQLHNMLLVCLASSLWRLLLCRFPQFSSLSVNEAVSLHNCNQCSHITLLEKNNLTHILSATHSHSTLCQERLLNNSVNNQLILIILVHNILRKFDTRKIELLPWEVHKAIYHQYSTVV